MKKRRKKKDNVIVPVASMGDIAFLLIIFFMVASRFANDKGNVTLAQSIEATEVKESKCVVSIDAEGVFWFQGEEVPESLDIKQGVKGWIDAQAKAGRTNVIARTVMFRCDKTMPRHVFEPVIEAISAGGGLICAVGEKSEKKGN